MKKTVSALLAMIFLFSGIVLAQFNFFSGDDWNKINSKDYSPETKTRLKLLILKTAQDASIFSGNPILSAAESNIPKYTSLIDKVYSTNENKNIPLYFALKIASMEKQGIPAEQIRIFKAALQKKMKL